MGIRGVFLSVLLVCVQGVYAVGYKTVNDSTACNPAPEQISSSSSAGQATVPQMALTEKAESLFGKLFKYAPIPYLGYSTETNLAFGVIKYNAFRIPGHRLPDSLIRLSNVSLYGLYTLNNQYEIRLKLDLMTGANRFNTVLEARFRDFPMKYFDVGNDTPEEAGELTDFKNLLIAPGFNYKIYRENYIGVRYIFDNYLKVKVVNEKEGGPDLGGNEGVQSGLGIKYFREGRDNRLRAIRGSYIYFSFDLFSHMLGSAFDYNALTIDLRKYYSPIPRLTFAGQIYSEIKSGDIPVQSLAVVGGKYRMRGIYWGRYRDKSMAMAQVEVRFPIYRIIRGTVFGGMGQVGPRLADYRGNGFHTAGGVGLRALIDKATSSVLRMDLGFSREGYTIFFGFGEAF